MRVPIPPKRELVLRYFVVWRRRRVTMPYVPDTRDAGSVIYEDEFPSEDEAIVEAARLLRRYPEGEPRIYACWCERDS